MYMYTLCMLVYMSSLYMCKYSTHHAITFVHNVHVQYINLPIAQIFYISPTTCVPIKMGLSSNGGLSASNGELVNGGLRGGEGLPSSVKGGLSGTCWELPSASLRGRGTHH